MTNPFRTCSCGWQIHENAQHQCPNVEASGETSDEAFEAADRNRTFACTHPSCRQCSWLSCTFCNVLVMEGKLYDRGGPLAPANDHAAQLIKRRWSLAHAPAVSLPRPSENDWQEPPPERRPK